MFGAIGVLVATAAAAEPVTFELSAGAMSHRLHLLDATFTTFQILVARPPSPRVLEPELTIGATAGGRYFVVHGLLGASRIAYGAADVAWYGYHPSVTAITGGPSLGVRLQAPLADGQWVPYVALAPGLVVSAAWSDWLPKEPLVQFDWRLDAGAGLQWMPDREGTRWGLFVAGGAAWCPLLTGAKFAPTAEIGVRFAPDRRP